MIVLLLQIDGELMKTFSRAKYFSSRQFKKKIHHKIYSDEAPLTRREQSCVEAGRKRKGNMAAREKSTMKMNASPVQCSSPAMKSRKAFCVCFGDELSPKCELLYV